MLFLDQVGLMRYQLPRTVKIIDYLLTNNQFSANVDVDVDVDRLIWRTAPYVPISLSGIGIPAARHQTLT
jgi:hypothetical protein